LPSRIQADVAPVEFVMDGRFNLPGELFLPEGEAHVWFVRLQEMSPHFESVLETLSPDEVARAARFRFEEHRNEYVLTRGFLRHIVGCYSGFAPHLLQFRYNSYGKPTLAAEWGGDRLSFSLSHSRGVAVYALTRDQQVGVNLEYSHQDVEFDQVAELYFSPREISLIRQLPSDKKQDAFFSCWTRKEAYVKARGEGLSLDLRSFDVAFAPDQPASLFSVGDDPNKIQRWSLAELSAPVGYTAAFAVGGVAPRIEQCQWPARSK
jgi:4'-phosphopantetheinyl transferase